MSDKDKKSKRKIIMSILKGLDKATTGPVSIAMGNGGVFTKFYDKVHSIGRKHYDKKYGVNKNQITYQGHVGESSKAREARAKRKKNQ